MIYEGKLRHKTGRACLNKFVVDYKCKSTAKAKKRYQLLNFFENYINKVH